MTSHDVIELSSHFNLILSFYKDTEKTDIKARNEKKAKGLFTFRSFVQDIMWSIYIFTSTCFSWQYYAVEFARGTLIVCFTFTDVRVTLHLDLVRLTGHEK